MKKKAKITRPLLLEPRLPMAAVVAALAVWVYIVVTSYFKLNPSSTGVLEVYFSLAQYPPAFGLRNVEHLFGNLMTVLLSALVFLAAYGAGVLPLKAFKIDGQSALEKALFSVSLGLGAIIMTVFAFGIAGLLYRGIVMAIIVAFAGYGILQLGRERPAGLRPPLSGYFTGFEKLWILLALFFSIVILIGCFSPETFYDSLVYHIAKPNLWIQNHRIMPSEAKVVTEFYPGNMNVVYAIGLLLKDETVCKTVHFTFTLLVCLAIYAMGRRYSGHRAGFLAAVLFFTIPYTGLLSYRSVMEMPLAFFETLAVFSFVTWLSQKQTGWLVLAGINCGIAIGTKNTSFYCLTALLAAMAADSLLSRKPFLSLVKSAVTLVGIAIAVSMPWWIYNYSYTGNPLYPFFWEYIGHLHPRAASDPAANIVHTIAWGKSIWQAVKGPWIVSMGQYEEAFTGPIMLLFFPLFLLLKSKVKESRILFFYIAVYWLIWSAAHQLYVRYFIPALPVVCFLCGYYIYESPINDYIRKMFFAVITLVIGANILMVMMLQKVSNNCLGVTLGFESKPEYLDRMRPTNPNMYYGMAQWINENLPHDALIASIGELRTYYIERRMILCDFANDIPLIVWAGEARDADDLYRKYKEKGVTHILLNVPEAQRLTVLDLIHFEGDSLRAFSQFWNKYVQEEHRYVCDNELLNQGIFSVKLQKPDWWNAYAANPFNYVYLYRLLSEEEARTPRQAPPNFFLTRNLYSKERWSRLEPVIKTIY